MAPQPKASEDPGRRTSSRQHPLILAATARTPAEADQWWRMWRDSVDLNDIPWDAIQMLPVLNDRLAGWLPADAHAARLRGIVRRAWAEAQYRLEQASGAAAALRQSGCEPVVLTGSAATCLLFRAGNTIRPIANI